MSEDRDTQAFMRSMHKWAESLANNQDNSKFGYADIEDVEKNVEETVN